jgi:hypothetical protein
METPGQGTCEAREGARVLAQLSRGMMELAHTLGELLPQPFRGQVFLSCDALPHQDGSFAGMLSFMLRLSAIVRSVRQTLHKRLRQLRLLRREGGAAAATRAELLAPVAEGSRDEVEPSTDTTPWIDTGDPELSAQVSAQEQREMLKIRMMTERALLKGKVASLSRQLGGLDDARRHGQRLAAEVGQLEQRAAEGAERWARAQESSRAMALELRGARAERDAALEREEQLRAEMAAVPRTAERLQRLLRRSEGRCTDLQDELTTVRAALKARRAGGSLARRQQQQQQDGGGEGAAPAAGAGGLGQLAMADVIKQARQQLAAEDAAAERAKADAAAWEVERAALMRQRERGAGRYFMKGSSAGEQAQARQQRYHGGGGGGGGSSSSESDDDDYVGVGKGSSGASSRARQQPQTINAH